MKLITSDNEDSVLQKYQILDTGGALLWESYALNMKSFLNRLVSQGKSLANADLSGCDLSRLTLNGVDFSNANLSNCDLSGANLVETDFRGASLEDAHLYGAKANGAMFQGANLTKAQLSGCHLERANFRGTYLDHANLSNVTAKKAVMTYSSMERTDLSNSDLRDVDFGNAHIYSANFNGANLESTGYIPLEHQANRTRKANIIGCKYDKNTKMSSKNARGFRYDKIFNRFAKVGLFASTSLLAMHTFDAVDKFTGMNAMTSISSFVGVEQNTLLMCGVTTLIGLMRNQAQSNFEELVNSLLSSFQKKVREIGGNAVNRARNIKNMIFAIGSEKSIRPLKRALTATRGKASKKKYISDFFYATSSDIGSFIVCDRRHLAMALGALSANRKRGYILSQDILLLRKINKDNNENVPSAIRFHKDGSTMVVWSKTGEPSKSMLYDEEGTAVASIDWENDNSNLEYNTEIEKSQKLSTALDAFQTEILKENDVSNFDYPKETHYVHYGVDGSVMVCDIATKNLDNPIGPALITPDNLGYFYESGIKLDKDPLPLSEWSDIEMAALLPEQREGFNSQYEQNFIDFGHQKEKLGHDAISENDESSVFLKL